MTASLEPFVIVGAGLAGATAAETLRSEGHAGEIVLIGAEEQPPYHRPPLTKEHLRGEGDGLPLVHDQAFYEEEGIDLRTSSNVERLDLARSQIVLYDGETIAYEKLLLATGAEPRRLRIDGGEPEGLVYLRTLGQSDQLASRLGPGVRVVVIGGGWIGTEAAASARQMGAEVTIVETAAEPLQRVLGTELGSVVRNLHEQNGVGFHTHAQVAAIEAVGESHRVSLGDGTTLDADIVIAAVGVEPRTALADGTPLTVENGLVVNAGLATEAPGVFAAGDVANAYHPFYGYYLRVEHWATAQNQGREAAKAMLGQDVVYDELPYFFSDQYDSGFEYFGHATEWDEVAFRGEPDDRSFVAFWLRDRRVAAALAFNLWDLGDPIQALIRSRRQIETAALTSPEVAIEELAGAQVEVAR